MPKEKIVILGGGMAGLSAAYRLSKTVELQNRYEITVYQAGWRLGGKCATGRNPSNRIQEHGLHFWFGCYENAFAMLREVYSSWRRERSNPLQNWTDALKPQNFTPIGGEVRDGELTRWRWEWPKYPGTPGDGGSAPLPIEILESLAKFLSDLIHSRSETENLTIDKEIHQEILRLRNTSLSPTGAEPDPTGDSVTGALFSTLRELVRAVENCVCSLLHKVTNFSGGNDDGIERIEGLFESLKDALRDPATREALPEFLIDTVELASALLRGVLKDVLWAQETPWDVKLHDIEFRNWLINHGANPERVNHCAVLRALYDTAIQYEDGDPEKPNMAASTGIIICVRLLATTKGAMLWKMQMGMGEAVIAPIYQVLLQNKVNFKFFRRVDRLVLSKDGSAISEIRLTRQADTKGGAYRPTKVWKGLICWPAEPLWDQLKDGDLMRHRGVNFESHWCDYPAAGVETLVRAEHFDHVILAVPLGEFKQQNSDPGLADEIIRASKPFRKMTETMGLVPTQSFQIWCSKPLNELGDWEISNPPAAVGWPEPFSIWSDMSNTLKYEPAGPGSVQYFCGPYKTQSFKLRRAQTEVPGAALNEVRTQAQRWLARFGPYFLPNLIDQGGGLRTDLLDAPKELIGDERLNSQFWRANIDPTECLPASNVGAVGFRLKAGQSGINNLYFAGCWVNTGFNVSCVEGAVMAGMQAARAISGEPKEVFAEDIFNPRRKAERYKTR